MKRLTLIIMATIAAIALTGCGAMSPDADAGRDQEVKLGDSITLSAAGSDRKNGDPLTYDWRIVSAPSGSQAELSDPHAMEPTFKPDKLGSYIFELVVDNDYHSSDPAEVKITCVAAKEADPVVFATDPSGNITLYDLASRENFRDEELVNFSLTFTFENEGDTRADVGVWVYGLDTSDDIVFEREINAGLDPGETRTSSLSVGEALTIDEYDSIETWEADPITVYEIK